MSIADIHDVDYIIRENAIKLHPQVSEYLTLDEFIFLIKAVMKRESNFNASEVMEEKNVNDYSIGLMQVRTATANWMLNINKTQQEMYQMLLEPNLNVYVGVKYLAYQINRYKGNLNLAVASYNSGTPKLKTADDYMTDEEAENYAGEPLINQGYVNDILRYYKGYLSGNSSSVIGSVAIGVIVGGFAIWLYKRFGG